MEYKRICKILENKGFKPTVYKNRIEFKVCSSNFKISYEENICSGKYNYFVYNDAFIPSQTYLNYSKLKQILINMF